MLRKNQKIHELRHSMGMVHKTPTEAFFKHYVIILPNVFSKKNKRTTAKLPRGNYNFFKLDAVRKKKFKHIFFNVN